MRRGLAFLTATALAVNGMMFMGMARGEDRDKASDDLARRPDNDASQSGAPSVSGKSREASSTTQPSALNAIDKTEIRELLAHATEAAVTRDGFNDFVERFSKADRERIGDFANKKFDDLNAQVATFRQGWKDKYGEEFDIKDKDKVYGGDQIHYMSGWTETARTAGERMEPSAPRRDTDMQNKEPGAAYGGGNKPADQSDNARTARADMAMDKDRATVTFARDKDISELSVPVMREGLGWRIDIPDSLDGQRLHDNLLTKLTKLNEQRDQWPSDKADAYRCVSHCVLMAAEDQMASSKADRGDTGR